MLKAIIIDDEFRSQQILKRLVEEYCPMVKVMALCDDVLSGIKAIHSHHPDFIFLDIEMPNYSGFKLLESFQERPFDVIFTTAYAQYAVDAFKVSALDYLLKPIDIDALTQAVEKVIKKRKSQAEKSLGPADEKNIRISLPVNQGILTIAIREVYYFESDGRYTHIHLTDGSRQTTKQSLKECEIQFKDYPCFLRIHRSFLINLYHVKQYTKGTDSHIKMTDDRQLTVGKGYKENLSEAISLFIR